MNRLSFLSHTMIMITILAIPELVLSGSSETADKSISKPPNPVESQATDMIDRQGSSARKYDVVPVRVGKLVDEKGGPLDHVVKNKKGETLGTIEKLLKDTKTGKTEYAVLELAETKEQLPLQWSQFQQEGGKLTLNASRKDLYPAASSSYSKDMSPDIAQYMDQINTLRSQPKPKNSQKGGDSGVPSGTGPMGESSVGGGGPSGTNPLPPGQAPGYEGGNPSSKR